MSNFCPNINSPEWQTLVDYFKDPSIVRYAYAINGNEIPTLEKAQEIIENAKLSEPDENYTLSSNELKLQKQKNKLLT